MYPPKSHHILEKLRYNALKFIHNQFNFVFISWTNLSFVIADPWYAYRSTAAFSFHLGYEVSVMVTSDGKYFYGRGCCYGVEYELQVWGTGRHGTVLGKLYGTVNAPPIGLDNGKESALLYLPKRNKLVYWKWNYPEFYVASARPRRIRDDGRRTLQWVPYNSYSYGLPLADGAASLSNDEADLLVFDYATLKLHRVDGGTFRITQTTQFASSTHILPPSPNEDLHTFAFDGQHYLFGAFHSGHCYGIYSLAGENLGSQCDKLGGSMLYYNWALHMFEACGTDSSAPPSFETFNNDAGNGAHCTFWTTPRTNSAAAGLLPDSSHHNDHSQQNNGDSNRNSYGDESGYNAGDNGGNGYGQDSDGGDASGNSNFEGPVSCGAGYPSIAGRYSDDNGNVWTIEQDLCVFSLAYDYVAGRSHLRRLPTGTAGTGGNAWGAEQVYLEVGSKQDPAYPGFTTSLAVVDAHTVKMGEDIVLRRVG